MVNQTAIKEFSKLNHLNHGITNFRPLNKQDISENDPVTNKTEAQICSNQNTKDKTQIDTLVSK